MLKLHSKKLALYLASILFILTAFVVSNHVITNVQAETSLASRLSGKILLQVEDNGEAWYLNPQDNKRSYLGRPHDAYNIMREEGIGITNDNLSKIPLSLDNLSGKDSDSDKLPDNFEIAIGTNPESSDTDSDGYDDYVEVLNNYSPRGDNAKRQTIDKSFAKSHQGKIFIQVEGNGEAWYVDTENNLRHYLGRPSDAFSIMRHLGLGITNTNLNQITIREGKGIQEYNYSEPKQEQQQGEENKEEYKNHITVTTHKPELMREFSNIIHVFATINDSSGYDFKEKGFLFDYTMNKDEVLIPTLANHKEKLIDNSPGLSIEAEIDNLLPKSYPYIRAYVITAEDIVYYGNTEVLILGNTETVDSIGAPGTPGVFNGGGGSSTPEPDSEPEYYNLTYTAGDNGYLATTASEVIEEPEIPQWQSKTNLIVPLDKPSSAYYNNYIYTIGSAVSLFGYGESVNATTSIFRYNTNNDTWDILEHKLTELPGSSIFSQEVNGNIYFIYYYDPGDGSPVLAVDIYNPEDDTFQNITSSISFVPAGIEIPYSSFNGDIYQNKLYAIGQNINSGDIGFQIFDLELNTFSFEAFSEFNFNIGMQDMIADVVTANGNLYMIMYSMIDETTLKTSFYTYNFTTHIFEEEYYFEQNMKSSSLFSSIIEYNNNILMLGGITMEGEGLGFSSDMSVYDTSANEIVKIIDLPVAYFTSSYTFNSDLLYQLGGGSLYTGGSTNTYSIDMSYLESYLQNINPEKIYLVEDRVEKGNDGVTVQAIPEDNYHFTSWSDGNTDNPRTDLNVTSNIDVTANFEIDTYTVNYNSDVNGSITGSTTQIVNHGSSTTAVEAIPNTNYRFVDWSDSSTDNPRTDLNVTSDIDVTANFEINNYDVVFDANGGTGTMSNQTITFNTSANLTNNSFTREGYTFTGWNTESNGSGTSYSDGSSFTMDVEGITLYAQWTANDYDIIFNANGGTGAMDNQTITFNTSANLTTNSFTREGYDFTGWNTESNGSGTSYSDGASFTMNVEGITLYAQWEMDCGDDVTFTYNGKEVTYGVVGNPDTGMCWLDRNLGATQVATAFDDPLSYGDLFQWGRGDDGHQERTSNTTSTLSSGDVPGHSDFITTPPIYTDWRSPQNDNLWQGETGINNPCPSGFRLPTNAELEAERNSWNSYNSSGAFNSPLKWSVAGLRRHNGSLGNVGEIGNIWSSSVSGSGSSHFDFSLSGADIKHHYARVHGYSVRCLRSNDNNSNDYDVVFDANGGTGTMSNQTITFNTSANLTTNSFIRANYTFTGWNTEANGSGTSYTDGSSFTMDVVGITLYAQWTINDYDVVFDANSGTGTISNQTITFNTSANLTTNSFTREGYAFTGWNTESNGSGTSYSDGSSFTMDVEGITLYAQWEMDCGDDVTFTYNGEEVTYGVVGNPDTGMCWLDRNLGATQVATALDDPDSYGDLFQWGRGDDGHQERTSNTTSTLSSGDDPGYSDFITSNSPPYDWRSPQNDNLWQGEIGINNPCPTVFRLPTSAELETEMNSWSSNNSSGAFNSPLKWAVAGTRSNHGSLGNVGSTGSIWSSSVSGSHSSNLYFYSSGAGIGNAYRSSGYSVRCLRD